MRKKRAIIYVGDYEEHTNKKKGTVLSITDDCKILPEELVIENVLPRLPVRTLARFSCLSKYWYNSIFNDTRFAAQHFAHQENNRKIVFSLLNVFEQDCGESCCIFSLEQKQNDKDVFIDYKLLSRECFQIPNELVGYCNGLACTREVSYSNEEYGAVAVINPARGETLALLYLNPTTTRGGGNGIGLYLCHGFGFDSSSQQYKVVLIYITAATTTTIAANVHPVVEQEFVCMVYALGGTKWRKIVTRISEISPPRASSSPPPRQVLVTRAWRKYRRSATLCGGDLYWRITNDNKGLGRRGDNIINNENNYEEMLLSFDIHSEKIQFIQLPAECSTARFGTTIQPDLVVDHHLLEYKGYPCVSICEKKMESHTDHHHNRRFHSSSDRGSFCCCRFGIHMYILKDKVKQVWTKEEFLDVTFRDTILSLLPPPFSRCVFESTTATTPPTRILSFSDQVVLYWFDGECLIYYNIQMNRLKVVKGSLSAGDKEIRDVFKAKMKGMSPGRNIGEDANSHCPYMDYELHAQVENILSLKTFIPRGGTMLKFECFDDFQEYFSSEENVPAGWLTTGRNSTKYDVFY